MFEKDSPQDLLLRGFSREYILDKTGTDVGYHGNAMKKELKGIDRVSYKVDFVKSNYTNDEVVSVLNEYAAGIDAATVLDRLGLAGVNIIKLNVLFKGLDLSDEFKDADKAHRKGIMKQGMLEKYGVEYYGQTAEARKAQSERMKNNLDSVLSKTRASMLKLYGVKYSWESAALRSKMQAIMRQRYGSTSYPQSDEYKQNVGVIQSKINATKRKNGTFNTSGIEERIKALKIFESQYNKDVRYPYLCDFYDKDRDLFIEVNASWTHGHHWYDAVQDADVCNKWKEKSNESQYYACALAVFTKHDVEKRNIARSNDLNYVTLWDRDGMDFDLWYAMGMPLGKDYEREYSWLPYHYIPEDVDVQNMRLSWRSLSAIVKDA